MIYKKILLFTIFLSQLLIAQEGMIMDGSLNRFYVKYNHPFIRSGRNLLGTIVLQNNNPDWFKLYLKSSNQGFLNPNRTHSSSEKINYVIIFEQGSGVIGDGVTIDYSEASMIVDHYILQSTNQTSATDISIKVILEIDKSFDDRMIAGDYNDEINIMYENNGF